jgi:hypothetical protein
MLGMMSGTGISWWGAPMLPAKFSVDQFKIKGNERSAAEERRRSLIAEIAGRQPPAFISSFDNELGIMRCCEAAWPCDKTLELRAAIKWDSKPAS